MAAKRQLVAGSRNRNEFVVINADDSGMFTSALDPVGHICLICGDNIELLEEGNDFFVACNECAFPVCRTCYEYERREGSQACPRCKTRYKRLKGSARVEGDEDEDGADDIYNELNYYNFEMREAAGVLGAKIYEPRLVVVGQNFFEGLGIRSSNVHQCSSTVPLLTYGVAVDEISSDHHALIVPTYGGFRGPVYQSAASRTVPFTIPRPIDPGKDQVKTLQSMELDLLLGRIGLIHGR